MTSGATRFCLLNSDFYKKTALVNVLTVHTFRLLFDISYSICHRSAIFVFYKYKQL